MCGTVGRRTSRAIFTNDESRIGRGSFTEKDRKTIFLLFFCTNSTISLLQYNQLVDITQGVKPDQELPESDYMGVI